VRCLTEFPFTFSETFELSLLHAAGVPREEEVRLDRDELEVRFYDEPELDLVELAVEQFVLAVPMKALCSEECQPVPPLRRGSQPFSLRVQGRKGRALGAAARLASSFVGCPEVLDAESEKPPLEGTPRSPAGP
jgi:hypothetical protein